MEITKTYPVNRIMHTRPTTEVARAAISLYKDHPELELLARNPKGSERGTHDIECTMVPGLLANLVGSYGTVEIVARGDLPKDVLERCADRIGEIYSKDVKEVPLGELLARRFQEDKKEEKPT